MFLFFMKTTLIFYKYLRLRGYSKALFLEQLKEALSGKTKSERSKQRNLFFKTKYNPQTSINDLRRALCKHWHQLDGEEDLRSLFPTPPMISYKRHKNLREFLVKSKLGKPITRNEDLDILVNLL
jgi:hypothetical protein